MARLVHKGSVKDLCVTRQPSDSEFGTGYMEFKDRPDGTGPVSIFDLKERMPFGIRGKRQAMYDETVKFFSLMELHDIPTHYLGASGLSKRVYIKMAHIPEKGRWEEWVKERGTKPFLVPIEVIISNDVTPPASLHKRLRAGKANPRDYGLERPPERGETITLAESAITTSTKLDQQDVYRDDLFDIVGLTEEKRDELTALARQANAVTRGSAAATGLYIADGKFEFIMGPEGELLIADTYMTSDENRLLAKTRDGRFVDLSKQFLRNLYTINGYREGLEAAQDSGIPFDEWPVMEPLDEETMNVVRASYAVVHQELCKKPMGLSLEKVATQAQDTLDRFKEKYGRDETGEPL